MDTTRTTRVLIVDDSLVLRERLVEMLGAVEGLEIVEPAQNASEAILSLESVCPEFVILDIQMPGGNGIDVLRQIKRECPQTKVAIFTNHAEPQYRTRCIELQADYFLSKSTDSNLLIKIGRELAEQNSAGKQL